MWTVQTSKSASKELDRAPTEIQEDYEAWKNVVLMSGPLGLKKINGYWDHALTGEWKGARASSLNKQWRVIYVVHADVVQVLVLRVSAHDYRSKG